MELTFNNSTSDKNYIKKFFDTILDIAASEVSLKSEKITLSINLVGGATIRKLNKKYRNKNRSTDVLSFPMHEKVDINKQSHDIIDLGDIFIAMPVIKKQARRKFVTGDKSTGNPAKDKKVIGVIAKELLAHATVHGFLHLAGYDHEKSEQGAKEMFGIEDKILEKVSSE